MGLGPSVGATQRGLVSHLSGGPTGMTEHVCCAYVGVGAYHGGCVCVGACSACFTILSACCTVTVPPLDNPSTNLDLHQECG